jgi:hypothetical protein
LGLLALFTHMHIFWVAALLLALIDIPDIGGWLGRIAGSVEKIADNQSNQDSKVSDAVLADPQATSAIKVSHENVAEIRLGDVALVPSQERARS